MEFKETDGGIVVPVTQPEPVSNEKPDHQVLVGWTFSKCGARYQERDDIERRKQALEFLYTAVSPGGGRIKSPKESELEDRLTGLLDELAIELVGGVPENFEEYT